MSAQQYEQEHAASVLHESMHRCYSDTQRSSPTTSSRPKPKPSIFAVNVSLSCLKAVIPVIPPCYARVCSHYYLFGHVTRVARLLSAFKDNIRVGLTRQPVHPAGLHPAIPGGRGYYNFTFGKGPADVLPEAQCSTAP